MQQFYAYITLFFERETSLPFGSFPRLVRHVHKSLLLSESYYLLKVNCVFNLLHLVLMKITTASCDIVSPTEE